MKHVKLKPLFVAIMSGLVSQGAVAQAVNSEEVATEEVYEKS